MVYIRRRPSARGVRRSYRKKVAGNSTIRRLRSKTNTSSSAIAASADASRDVEMSALIAMSAPSRSLVSALNRPTRKTILKYVYMDSKVSGGAVTGVQAFRLNGIFDPDFTGVGAQPYLRDQWATLYNFYQVDKAVIRITGNSTGSAQVCFRPSKTSAPSASVQLEIERPWSRSAVVGTDFPFELTTTVDMRTVLGYTKAEYDDVERAVAQGSNPAVPVYGHLTWIAHNTSTVITLNYTVEILYYTTMSHPVEFASS